MKAAEVQVANYISNLIIQGTGFAELRQALRHGYHRDRVHNLALGFSSTALSL